MSLTAREVAEILRVLEESSFDTLDLEMNGVQLHLRRSGAAATAGRPTPAPSLPQNSMATPAAPPPAPDAPAGGIAVPAPLLGIFYRAPKPGEPPFVQVGDRVAADTIIGIVEVMKLMNTVRAGVAGEVIGISAANGELVEFGQALLWVRPG